MKLVWGWGGVGVTGVHRTGSGGHSLDESRAPGGWRLSTPEEQALLQGCAQG